MTSGGSRADELFEAALDLPPSERARFLSEACDDEAVRAEVLELLDASARTDGVLDRPLPLLDEEALRDVSAGLELEAEGPDPLLAAGSRVGAYRPIERIGRGGMGAVYLAERADGQFEQRVALKVVHASGGSEELVRRFLHERQMLARIQHPNIARLYDGGLSPDGRPYFVMEYVDGRPLTDVGRELPVEERIGLFEAAIAAVEHAHGLGIVHRDLKPSNILVADDGRVVLLDFGIAKLMGDPRAPTVTGAGRVVLTPAYASPEQKRAGPVTPASDVYQLGLILYELIAGRPPVGDEPESPTVVAGAPRPGDLDAICLTALSVEPGRRYPSAASFAADLARYLAGRTVEAAALPIWRQGLRFLGRHRIVVGASAGLLVVGSAAGYWLGAGSGWRLDWTGGQWLLFAGVAVAGLLVVWALAPDRAGRSRDVGVSESQDRASEVLEGATPRRPRSPGPGELDERTVAVLPFRTLDGRETDPFAAGLHDDVLTELSRVRSLTVISRSSVHRYASGERDIPAIGRDLRAGTVVEGTVQRIGDRVRLNIQVVDARTDAQRWAERYDRELTASDIFDLQSELAHGVARTLASEITTGTATWRGAPTGDLEAYRLYSQGRRCMIHRSEAKLREAAGHYRRAVERDPDYALAWAGLANALILLGDYLHVEGESVYPKGEKAARRAVALDPSLAEAHSALGNLYSATREVARAIRCHERALELEPGFAGGNQWLCWTRLLAGNASGARAAGIRAIELDPLDTEARTNYGVALVGCGDAEGALREAGKIRETDPEAEYTRWLEGVALQHLGREADAANVMMSLAERWSRPWAETSRALASIASGADSREMALAFEAAAQPFHAAVVRLARGDAEAALSALERSSPLDWPETLYFRYPPQGLFDPIESDRRYVAWRRSVDRSWGIEAPD